MRKRKFNINLWKEKETDLFVITCDNPEVATQGKTLKEAFEMLGDAIELMDEENKTKKSKEIIKSKKGWGRSYGY